MYDPLMTLTMIYSVEGTETVWNFPNIPLTHAYTMALQAAEIQTVSDNDEFTDGPWKCIGFSCVRNIFRETDADNVVVVRREETETDSFLYMVLYREEEDGENENDIVSVASSTDIDEVEQIHYEVFTPPAEQYYSVSG